MANGRIEARCDNCGQTDDHPKMHYGPQTFHHDCIPAYVLDDLTSESYYHSVADGGGLIQRIQLPEEEWHPSAKLVLALRDKAMSGVRGNELLAHIQQNSPKPEEG